MRPASTFSIIQLSNSRGYNNKSLIKHIQSGYKEKYRYAL